ncbi:MAG TPA: 50S ribosomal protein L23, partial [Gammaproteobacteria bacterium]|nr:50S ribosomal protein L23 [Gammaproteobacteria bacterium]
MNQERLFKVLLAPLVSEKATLATEKNNQVVFKVAADATKPEVKQAVEQLFDVEVQSVNICNIKGKKKRFGMRSGRRRATRKAYVTLKPGQDIGFMAEELG